MLQQVLPPKTIQGCQRSTGMLITAIIFFCFFFCHNNRTNKDSRDDGCSRSPWCRSIPRRHAELLPVRLLQTPVSTYSAHCFWGFIGSLLTLLMMLSAPLSVRKSLQIPEEAAQWAHSSHILPLLTLDVLFPCKIRLSRG